MVGLFSGSVRIRRSGFFWAVKRWNNALKSDFAKCGADRLVRRDVLLVRVLRQQSLPEINVQSTGRYHAPTNQVSPE